ncbi:MAG: efflux RND transporter periplasmic adaptor subunit [Anaerolineae bacterium]|jgi:RND family efflux transporter MFP subunit
MTKFIRFVAIIGLISAMAVGAVWLYQTRIAAQTTADSDTYTQVVAVQQGDLSASISVVGALEAAQDATLAFDRLSGVTNLLRLDVAAGNTVEAGQTLASVDPTPYQQALDQAHTALQGAEQALADLQELPTGLDITEADLAVADARLKLEQALAAQADLQATPDVSAEQAAVQSAQDNLALARLQQTLAEHDSLAMSERNLQYSVQWRQRRISDLQALQAQGKANLEQIDEIDDQQEALAEDQADLARIQAQRQLSLQTAAARVANALAELADAQDALADAQANASALSLAQAQVNVQSARVNVQAAEEARADLDAGPDAVKLATAQADMDKKRLVVADAEADLAATTLVAPFSGTVLETNAQPGDRISASSPILTLANMDELQVVATVDETTIRQIQAGQSASISFDALPGQSFSGQVLSAPLQGALQGGVMVYEVPVSLSGADALPLLVGMTANVAIDVGQTQNALLVPAMAVQTVGGMAQVLVPNASDPANPVAVPVQVGLSNGTYTEIVRGLNLGDQVVVQLSSSSSDQFRLVGPDGGMDMMIFSGGPPGGGAGAPPDR